MSDPQRTFAPVLSMIAARWQSQHRDHAAQLAAAVTAAGRTPVAEGSVRFTPPAGFTRSISNVLRLACNTEKGADPFEGRSRAGDGGRRPTPTPPGVFPILLERWAVRRRGGWRL